MTVQHGIHQRQDDDNIGKTMRNYVVTRHVYGKIRSSSIIEAVVTIDDE